MQLESIKIRKIYLQKLYIFANVILSNSWLPSRKTLSWESSTDVNSTEPKPNKAEPGAAAPTELRSEQVQPHLPAGQESEKDSVSGHPGCDCSWLSALPNLGSTQLRAQLQFRRWPKQGSGPQPMSVDHMTKVQDALIWPGNSPDHLGP